uniref:C2H2-type domain-containing protein n=1 Tax=Photinus pyralis TaxID=7054 RepID=A0A1Y1NC62_PHOPY
MPKCKVCSTIFQNINSLITHMRILHRAQDNDSFICGEPLCNRNFSSLRTYRQHLKVHVECVPINERNTTVDNSILATNLEVQCNDSNTNASIISQQINQQINDIENNLESTTFQNSFFDFADILKKNKLLFLCQIYNVNTFNRKDVDNIMNMVSNLLLKPLDMLKKFCVNLDSLSERDKFEFKKYFNEFENMFSNFESDYLRLKYLEQAGSFVPPTQLIIGQHLEKSDPIAKNYTAQFISLKAILQKFFALDNVLDDTLTYISSLEKKSGVSNIIQTKFWKDKISCYDAHDIVLPLFLYYDDFEAGNPLGSHAGVHKIGTIYFSIPCLPIYYRSQLENIFLTQLFHSSDLKSFGEAVMFSKLVDELNELKRQGIKVSTPQREVHLYFCMTLILGDNLGLNTILGFQQSFVANSFCRFCKCLRTETQSLFEENSSFLRNVQNYTADVAENNAYLTGVKYSTILNNVDSFHVTLNFSADLAHDIFEGVGVFIMSHLLYEFVLVDKFFDNDTLNHKIEYFNFNRNDNKPPVISLESIKKKILKMSASEMKCFILNFSLMMAHLIPEGNKHWNIYLLLRDVLHIALSLRVTPDQPIKLKSLIYELCFQFKDLFSVLLKPKFHFLTHYPTIMEKIGPLSQTNTLRYESKHRQLKLAANVISSRVNITRSLAIKHQLQLSLRFSSNTGFTNSINYSKSFKKYSSITDLYNKKFANHSNVSENLKMFEDNIIRVGRISTNSIAFQEGDIILIDFQDQPTFGKIRDIIINQSEKICFICELLHTIGFNRHFYAFEVELTDSVALTYGNELECYNTHTIIVKENKQFISLY